MNRFPTALLLSVSILRVWVAVAACQDSSNGQDIYEEAQQALSQGRYAEAEQAYEKIAHLDPNVAEIHANLGLIYFEERKFDQAVPELRQALKLKPALTKSSVLLAISLSELGRYTEALPGLEKSFRQSTAPETKRMCGLQLERAYNGLRREDKAVEVALELNQLYPNDPEVLYHNGKIFGNFAFLSMQKLAQVAPDSVWRHEAAAEANESQGSYDAAIIEFRQVLARDPQRSGIHYRLGRNLLARSASNASVEDAATASREFEQELKIDPTSASAAYELAEIDRKSGQLEEAQGYFELAIQHYPDFEQALVGLASVLMARQKPELALPRLQKALSLNAQDEVAWYRLSQAEKMMGNSVEQQKAMAEFQRLHSTRESHQQTEERNLFSPDEVTKQQLDTSSER